MTRRDRSVVAALVTVFAVLAIVIAVPSLNRAITPDRAGPDGGSSSRSPGPSSSRVAGRSGDPEASTDGTPQASVGAITTTAPAAPVIRHGIVGQPTSINPLTARSQADRDLVALVFSGLVKLGPKGTVIPDLADEWTSNVAGTQWTFHIRQSAVWHDGEDVTADDVVFTIKLLRDPAYAGPFQGSWNEITVKKIDIYTVRFTLKSPLGDFLQLARQPLLPSHLLKDVPVEALVDSAFSIAPVGSGPYQLLQWDTEMALLQQATIATGIDSGSPGPSAAPVDGALPRIQLMFYPTPTALANAYRDGEVDMADGLPAALATDLEALPGTSLIRYPRSTLTAVLFNLRPDHPTIRDQTVRQALLQAIDRDKLVKDILGGLGVRADSLIPPTSWAYVTKAATPVAYSTTAAAKALQAADWRKVNGKWHTPGSKSIFSLEIVTTTKAANPVAWEAAQFVARSWRSFGITVTVVALSPNDLVGDRLSQANFTVAVVDMNIGLDPDLYPLLASRQAGVGGSNLSGVQSLVLDDLLIAARKPGTLAQRRSAWSKLESFLAEAQVTLPLAFRDDAMVVSDRLVGPVPHLQGDLSDRFWDVLIWRLASGG